MKIIKKNMFFFILEEQISTISLDNKKKKTRREKKLERYHFKFINKEKKKEYILKQIKTGKNS